jgi:hypothetical protein
VRPRFSSLGCSLDACEPYGKPAFVRRLDKRLAIERFGAWIARHHINILNIVGPGESKCPGTYHAAIKTLTMVIGRECRHASAVEPIPCLRGRWPPTLS